MESDDGVHMHNDWQHHRLRHNRHGMARNQHAPREVRDDSIAKMKFNMPSFSGKYDPDAYLDWELVVDQKFACYDFSENKRVRAATSEFTDFASVGWKEFCRNNPNNIPQTWDALKRTMRARFVPSYYARDLLNKLQRLTQGSNSVEEYYQALQMGMLRCGLIEGEDAQMARYLGGLNREIQDILEYKEYNSITRLFHLACKAEGKCKDGNSGHAATSEALLPHTMMTFTSRRCQLILQQQLQLLLHQLFVLRLQNLLRLVLQQRVLPPQHLLVVRETYNVFTAKVSVIVFTIAQLSVH